MWLRRNIKFCLRWRQQYLLTIAFDFNANVDLYSWSVRGTLFRGGKGRTKFEIVPTGGTSSGAFSPSPSLTSMPVLVSSLASGAETGEESEKSYTSLTPVAIKMDPKKRKIYHSPRKETASSTTDRIEVKTGVRYLEFPFHL